MKLPEPSRFVPAIVSAAVVVLYATLIYLTLQGDAEAIRVLLAVLGLETARKTANEAIDKWYDRKDESPNT